MAGERLGWSWAPRPRQRRLPAVATGVWLMVGLCLLSACSGVSKPPPAGKAAAPVAGGYKVGKPYAINGIWYFPRVDYAYDEVGIASWYGPGFDGQPTANGETYDMNELTAAHKTLPMPSFVRVTNLDNGRVLKLRINDRGPFVDGRIIDVSRRGAQLLGFFGNGTARVRVEIIAGESREIARLLTGSDQDVAAAESVPAAAAVVAPATTAPAAAVAEVSPEAPPAMLPVVAPTPTEGAPAAAAPKAAELGSARAFVQAGAFARANNARRVEARLSRLGAVAVDSASVDGRDLFRVRLGPFHSDAEAHRVLAEVIREGFAGSQVVFE